MIPAIGVRRKANITKSGLGYEVAGRKVATGEVGETWKSPKSGNPIVLVDANPDWITNCEDVNSGREGSPASHFFPPVPSLQHAVLVVFALLRFTAALSHDCRIVILAIFHHVCRFTISPEASEERSDRARGDKQVEGVSLLFDLRSKGHLPFIQAADHHATTGILQCESLNSKSPSTTTCAQIRPRTRTTLPLATTTNASRLRRQLKGARVW
jgi:hypothetical protein